MKDFLKQLTYSNSHNARVKLIQQKYLGTRKRHGSSRICIPLSNNLVLKVAKNEKGIAQNRFEAECYKYANQYQKRFLAKVIQNCNYDTWLIQQRVSPLTRNNGNKVKEQLLKVKSFNKMILNLDIDERDIDQIGRVGKHYKLYDYGVSPHIFRTYY